jgi:hypothetical protein
MPVASFAMRCQEGRVVSLVVTIIVRTDVALLARTKIDHQLVEPTTTTNGHILLSIMDVVAGFYQGRKVAPGPGADAPTARENVSEVSCIPMRRNTYRGECRASCFLRSAILAKIWLQPAAAEQI